MTERQPESMNASAMAKHHPENWDEMGRCLTCGSSYHCHKCGGGTGMYGHLVKDDDGEFFWCQDPDRSQRRMKALMKVKR